MLKRDFTKSNKTYFKQNWVVLLCLALFLIVGVLVAGFCGMNGNFEFTGYNEFTISASTEDRANFKHYNKEIASIVNSYGGKFDNVSVFGEGEECKLVVRYMNTVSAEDQREINTAIITKITEISDDEGYIPELSAHHFVEPSVRSTDYIFTAVAILILVLVATIFAYFRYNDASAISTLLACAIGTLSFMSLGAITRLTIGKSYFAMLLILNVLLIYFAFMFFEHIREEGFLKSDSYEMALNSALKAERKRAIILAVAVYVIGLLFCLFGTNPIRYVSINVMFIAVAMLFTVLYVLPFVWSALITRSRKKHASVKVKQK